MCVVGLHDVMLTLRNGRTYAQALGREFVCKRWILIKLRLQFKVILVTKITITRTGGVKFALLCLR